MPVDQPALQTEASERQHREPRFSIQFDAANQALESFSQSVSHDLRAPLRAVDSLIQILEEDYGERLGEDGCRVLNVIHDACGTMDNLITALLAFSQAVRQEMDPVQLDMAALVREAVNQVISTCPGPAPIIAIGDLPVGIGDALLLRQVWCQLISNALKFSSKRQTPNIGIRGRIEGAEVIYLVEDNGVGFDMRYVHKLFGIFQRLHKSEDFAGTGIGLAIAKNNVARHGGRIWAEAATDDGARFQFALPLVVKVSQ